MFCYKCGHENQDAAVFCNACGTKLNGPVSTNENKEFFVVQSSRLANITDAIAKAFKPCSNAWRLFINNWHNYRGRITRSEFWWVYSAFIIINLFLGILVVLIEDISLVLSLFLYQILKLVIAVPECSLLVRRLHDAGYKYSWVLVGVTLLFFRGLVVLAFAKSDTDNEWGCGPTEACLSGKIGFLQNDPMLSNYVFHKIRENAPKSYEDPQVKKEFDQALAQIIPDFVGNEDTPSAFLEKTDPELIVANIREANINTLIKIYNALDFYIDTDTHPAILKVKNYVLTVLAGKMASGNTEE